MIYFLRHIETGLIKIGKTRDKATRFYYLTRQYGKLELLGLLPGYTRQEAELHQLFNKLNVRGVLAGQEWFSPADELMSYIETNASLNLPLPMIDPEDDIRKYSVSQYLVVRVDDAVKLALTILRKEYGESYGHNHSFDDAVWRLISMNRPELARRAQELSDKQ